MYTCAYICIHTHTEKNGILKLFHFIQILLQFKIILTFKIDLRLKNYHA